MNELAAANAVAQGVQQMGLSIDSQAVDKLVQYAFLLAKWSQVYNLTTIRTVDQIIPLHILDSLVLLPYVANCKQLLDVGTGAGLPGMPLAICNPKMHCTLLDSQQKKVTFMQNAIRELLLPNVTATHSRIEKLQVSYRFDMVVSRAFASLDDFVNLIAHVCDSQTKVVAMKAKQDLVMQELKSLPSGFELVNIEQVTVPGINAERCLVFLKRRE